MDQSFPFRLPTCTGTNSGSATHSAHSPMAYPPPPPPGIPHGHYPYVMPVPANSTHPMYYPYPYPGASMSPVHPAVRVGAMAGKVQSPSIPTNSQHTPDSNSSAARSLGKDFNVTGKTEAQKNYEKFKSAFEASGVRYESSDSLNATYTDDDTAVADIVSRVKAVGGKVISNPSDKTLSIHFADTSDVENGSSNGKQHSQLAAFKLKGERTDTRNGDDTSKAKQDSVTYRLVYIFLLYTFLKS